LRLVRTALSPLPAWNRPSSSCSSASAALWAVPDPASTHLLFQVPDARHAVPKESTGVLDMRHIVRVAAGMQGGSARWPEAMGQRWATGWVATVRRAGLPLLAADWNSAQDGKQAAPPEAGRNSRACAAAASCCQPRVSCSRALHGYNAAWSEDCVESNNTSAPTTGRSGCNALGQGTCCPP
jgi:hypothetical protein